jgi:hypothetical protein
LRDTCTGLNTRHGLAALLRQSLFSRLAGYEDLNYAQRLRVDPAMRTVVGGGARDLTTASAPGSVVTILKRTPKRVIKFYNGRGTAEQWIKEGKHALKWTRLSCRRFKDNQARLQLFALAYNLGNFLRQLALPLSVQTSTLTTLREKLMKIGAKVVHHARAVTFQLAAVAVPRALFAAILVRIGRLRAAPSSG